MQKQIDEFLVRFSQIAVPGSFDYPFHHQHVGGEHDYHILFSSIIHGNEVGSLPAVLRCIEDLKEGRLRFGGTATFTLGNPEAARCNRRFLETDLNRVFLETDLETHEANRARALMPIMQACDLLIDFHQTILDTLHPFYIFPWTAESGMWARALNISQACVDATPDASKPIKTQCADDFVRLQGKPAVTLELGRKGFSRKAEEDSFLAIKRAMELADGIAKGALELSRYASNMPTLFRYRTVHREPFRSMQHQLRPGFVNFMAVEAGELLSPENGKKIRAPVSGKILFPKYPTGTSSPPKELYRIITPIS